MTRYHHEIRAPRPLDTHYLVVISVFGRSEEWRKFATLEGADCEVAKLRKHGFHARTIAPEPAR